MKKNIIISITLFVVCALAAFTLSALNSWTKPIIEKNEKKKIEDGLSDIFKGFKDYSLEKVSYSMSESKSKSEAKIIEKYTLSFEAENDKYVYMIEATNGFGGSKMMVGVNDLNIITKVVYINFSQTNEPAKIQGLIDNEYIGVEAASNNILSYQDVKDGYSGVTKGSVMMNLAIEALANYIESEVAE